MAPSPITRSAAVNQSDHIEPSTNQPAGPLSYPYADSPTSFVTNYAPLPDSNNLQRPVSYPDAIPDHYQNPYGQSAFNDAGVLPAMIEGIDSPSYPPGPQYPPLGQTYPNPYVSLPQSMQDFAADAFPESSFRATKAEAMPDETEQEEADDDQEEPHEQERGSTPKPRPSRKYAPPGPPVKHFQGYPSDDVDPPPNLSLYEVCQQYPASLKHDNLHDFLQRRWSVEEIYACLPDDVKDFLERRGFEQKTNYLYKRVQKEEKKLKPMTKGADGRMTKDVTLYLDLLNAPKRREDGRPSLLRTLTSRQSPPEHWRIRHGIGVDPRTGIFVELPDDPNENAPDLLRAVPADLRNSTQFVDDPSGQGDAGQASLRLREPTLASVFPNGMINLRGAYVRTISPNGTAIWRGAPSPEFVDAYMRDS